MSEESTATNDKKEETSQSKVVPIADLIALKKASGEKIKQLMAGLEAKTTEVEQLTSQVEELKSLGDSETAEGKKKLIELGQRLAKQESALKKREKELSEKEAVYSKASKVDEIAEKYKVPREVLLESDEPLEAALDYLSKGNKVNDSVDLKKGQPAKATNVKEMSDTDFNQLWDKMKSGEITTIK